MKIIENTQNRMIVRDRPWMLRTAVIALGFAALIAAGLGVGMSAFGEQVLVGLLGISALWIAWDRLAFQTFTFDRAGATVMRLRHRLGAPERTSYPLRIVTGMRWQSGGGEYAGFGRLVLETTKGDRPVEAGFSPASKSATARAITGWLTAAPGRN